MGRREESKFTFRNFPKVVREENEMLTDSEIKLK